MNKYLHAAIGVCALCLVPGAVAVSVAVVVYRRYRQWCADHAAYRATRWWPRTIAGPYRGRTRGTVVYLTPRPMVSVKRGRA